MAEDLIRMEDGLAMRLGVGMVVLNRSNRVLVGVNRSGTDWRYPQGGRHVEAGIAEPPQMAALRELREEVGLRARDLKLLAELPTPTRYRLPPVAGCDGKVLDWLVYRYLEPGLPDLSRATDDPLEREFGSLAWLVPHKVLALAPDYRKPVYTQVTKMLEAAFPQLRQAA